MNLGDLIDAVASGLSGLPTERDKKALKPGCALAGVVIFAIVCVSIILLR